MIVARETDPDVVERLYTSSERPGISLARNLSSADLLRFCSRHANRPYTAALFSLIVSDPAATKLVLQAAMRRSRYDPSVLNSIATSARTPSAILLTLARSRHASVREHARLGLLKRRLSRGLPTHQLLSLLGRSRGDSGISLGIRLLVATSKRTPKSVLNLLRSDDADLVSIAARRSLESSGTSSRGHRPARHHRK
jgi:hypothetical protein